MQPLAADTMVQFNNKYYWVDQVLETGSDPLYRLRQTALAGLAKQMTVARHSQLRVCGGVLIGVVY